MNIQVQSEAMRAVEIQRNIRQQQRQQNRSFDYPTATTPSAPSKPSDLERMDLDGDTTGQGMGAGTSNNHGGSSEEDEIYMQCGGDDEGEDGSKKKPLTKKAIRQIV